MYKNINTKKGLVTLLEDDSVIIQDTQTFLGVMLSGDTETLVLKKENLHPSFFELRSGLAGDILQKVSNYRARLIILGDFSKVTSKALKDFIYESNRRGKVVFSKTLEEGVEKLK